MLKRLLVTSAMCLSLITLSGIRNVEAAKVCMRIGGTILCYYYTGGMWGILNAVGTQEGDYLGFWVYPPYNEDGELEEKIPVIVFCGNHGRFNQVAKGVNPGEVSGEIGSFMTVRKQDVRNGRVEDFEVHVTAPPEVLAQVDYICAEELNPNWIAVDIVPIECSTDNTLLDEDMEELATSKLCHDLPDWETLQWDNKAKAPEKRFYNTHPCP